MSATEGRGLRHPVGADLLLLIGLTLLLVAAGMGLRDPWPADEPRFALAARDMVLSGDWLFPRVGGDLYPDKPPVFMWLIALCYFFTGSLRIAFLLPSLLAATGTIALIYDLGRRLWNREAGRWAALALLFTIQFTLQAKRAQIDMVLVFWTTLSMYGFLRYLLLGHRQRWWALGGAAAGVGVITKGVGFLPFLVLLPYGYARRKGWKLPAVGTGRAWAIAPLAFVAAIGLWLVPMLIAAALSGDTQLAAYRDEILFHQTAQRYVSAWHHHQPPYYYLTVILSLWLPLAVLLPWLVPRWRERLQVRDARVLLLLGWILLVLLFFSLSPGKRGVYIFPALPALALVSGEWLRGLSQRRGVQRAGVAFAWLIVLVCAGALVYFLTVGSEKIAQLHFSSRLGAIFPLAAVALLGAAAAVTCGVGRGVAACAWVLGILWVTVSFAVMPQLNGERSAAQFIARLQSLAAPDRELGLLAYREQFLLRLTRPSVNFGHARWREGENENNDAARWLNEAAGRQLLVPEGRLRPCFDVGSSKVAVGDLSDERWFLVEGPAAAACAGRGDAGRAIAYPPFTGKIPAS